MKGRKLGRKEGRTDGRKEGKKERRKGDLVFALGLWFDDDLEAYLAGRKEGKEGRKEGQTGRIGGKSRKDRKEE